MRAKLTLIVSIGYSLLVVTIPCSITLSVRLKLILTVDTERSQLAVTYPCRIVLSGRAKLTRIVYIEHSLLVVNYPRLTTRFWAYESILYGDKLGFPAALGWLSAA